MPASENDRRNQQAPTLENPSMPDHDRTKDEGMHAAIPTEMMESPVTNVGGVQEGQANEAGSLDDSAISAPDQEFQQVLDSGPAANHGRIPQDPNNWLTSDPENGYNEGDPESRGESLADIVENDKH